jgi:hypothetical protein
MADLSEMPQDRGTERQRMASNFDARVWQVLDLAVRLCKQ